MDNWGSFVATPIYDMTGKIRPRGGCWLERVGVIMIFSADGSSRSITVWAGSSIAIAAAL